MKQIDYDMPATLYVARRPDSPTHSSIDSQDFLTLAEAIKFAAETLSPEQLQADATHISAATQRVAGQEIRAIYDRGDFPLR